MLTENVGMAFLIFYGGNEIKQILQTITSLFKSIIGFIQSVIFDIFFFSGVGLIGFGAYQIYEPACPIVVGSILIWIAISGVKTRKIKENN